MLAAWVLSENMSCSICTASQLAAPTDIFAKDHKKTTHSRERPRTPRAVHLLIPTVRGQRRKPKNLFFAKKALVAFFPRPISAFFEIYTMCILLHRSNPRKLANFRQHFWWFLWQVSQTCEFLSNLSFSNQGLMNISRNFTNLFRETSYQALTFRQFSFKHRQDSLHRK